MNSFSALLDTLIASPPDRKLVIEELIRDAFQREKAVLALDMSGFTLSVRRDGILSYLCQIRRMQKMTGPIVLSHGGDVVKYEADNLLAVFDDPVQSVEAALEMIDAAADEEIGDAPRLGFSIGIDYGELLLIDRVDCFGDPVNLSHKLGEDTAGPGELLVTDKVRESLGEDCGLQMEEMSISISGITAVAYSVSRDRR